MLLDKADIEPEVYELIKQNIYTKECAEGGAVICVITFLPNIYDSNAVERKGYIETLQKVAKTQRKQPFVFFWL